MSRLLGKRSLVSKLLIVILGILFGSLGIHTYAANCTLLAGRSPGTLQDGSSLTGYKANNASYTQTCAQLKGTITCNNGIVNNGNLYKYQTCIDHTWDNCTTPTPAPHLSLVTLYKASQSIYNQTCSQLSKSFQCLDGSFSGQGVQSYIYGTCNNQSQSSCINIWTNSYINHGDSLIAYTQSNGPSCSSYKKTLTCINGSRSGGNQAQLVPSCVQTNNGDCTLSGGVLLASGQNIYGYSTVLWTMTGQDYSNGCTPFSGKISCINGNVQGSPSVFKYTLNQCQSGTPKSCTLAGFPNFSHGISKIAYLATGAKYPKACTDIQTTLKCVNGNINGNYQTYVFPNCTSLNQLVPGIDISLEGTLNQEAQGALMSQGSSPLLALSLKNKGNQIVSTSAPAGFVVCQWQEKSLPLYTSPALQGLVINPGTKIALNIKLSSLFTQSLGSKTVVCTINTSNAGINDQSAVNNIWSGTFEIVTSSRFDIAMEQSLGALKKNLEAPEALAGAEGVKSFLFNRLIGIVLPLVIAIGILLALLGFYKIMFSSDDKAIGEGTNFIIYGVIGIILIVSAKYIGTSLVSILTPGNGDIQGWKIAQDLYDKIAFPFIKFAMYLVLGAMFIILLSRVISFLFGSDADAKKKAGTLIGWNIISMFVIIGAKQIIEAVYGKQADVAKSISNLGEIGSGVLADKNIPLLYHIVNRVLGLTSLVLLILIIVQTLQLLLKPSDEKQMTSVKNTLLYMVIGLLVIGAGYLIVNFLVIN